MRIAAYALICTGIAAWSVQAADADEATQTRIDASRAVIGDFATRLKGALVTEMEKSGPAGAIEVCRSTAPAIAADASARTGWDVGRTSLKTRNADNAPDAWEREVLRDFAARQAAGADPAAMDAWVVVESDGNRQLRYMKAIPTASLCLTCHGTNVDPALLEKIKAAYPNDTATGYSEGEVRGAFTITQPM